MEQKQGKHRAQGENNLVLSILYIALGLLAVRLLFGILLPFSLAWLTVTALRPWVNFCARHTRIPRRVLSTVTLCALLVLLGYGLFWVCDRMLYESGKLLSSLAQNADSMIDRVFSFFRDLSQRIPLFSTHIDPSQLSALVQSAVNGAISAFSARLPAWVGSLIAAFPKFVIFCIVFLLSSYYISIGYDSISAFVLSCIPPRAKSFLHRAKQSLTATAFRYLRAYGALLCLTFAELLIGFFVLRISYAFTMAVLVAAVDILPVLGVGTVLLPWAGISFLSGNTPLGIGLLILWGIIWVVRQISEPRIVGGSIGLHPLATLIAIYTGYRILGIAGVLLFPILAIFAKNLLDGHAERKSKSF